MKTFTLAILLMLLSTASYAQGAYNDTLRISPESIIDVNVERLTRELNLNTEQQENLKLFFIANEMIVMPDVNTSAFMNLLSVDQRELYRKIIDSEEQSLRSSRGNSTMRVASAREIYTLSLEDADYIKDVRPTINNNPSAGHAADENYSMGILNNMFEWTHGGYRLASKVLMRFIVDDIPVGSEIVSATLYLYSDPSQTSTHSIESNCTTSGSNACYVERVTEPWDDLTVTWNTMPTSTTEGRLLLPISTSITENIEINITNMVQKWVNNPSNNYGVKFFLQTESPYRARSYASMEHSNTLIRPKLIISYYVGEGEEEQLSTIEFIYDASGNRIKREVIIIPAKTRTAENIDSDDVESEEPIESSWNQINLKIYPNPTYGDISISFSGNVDFEKVQYHLYSSLGNMVGKGYINAVGTSPVEMSQLSAGIYMLTLQYNNETKTYKIIKK